MSNNSTSSNPFSGYTHEIDPVFENEICDGVVDEFIKNICEPTEPKRDEEILRQIGLLIMESNGSINKLYE